MSHVLVTEEVTSVWEFTVDEFVETYHEEWVHAGKPDPEKWVRESIEELGSDQLDRVAARKPDDYDLQVIIR